MARNSDGFVTRGRGSVDNTRGRGSFDNSRGGTYDNRTESRGAPRGAFDNSRGRGGTYDNRIESRSAAPRGSFDNNRGRGYVDNSRGGPRDNTRGNSRGGPRGSFDNRGGSRGSDSRGRGGYQPTAVGTRGGSLSDAPRGRGRGSSTDTRGRGRGRGGAVATNVKVSNFKLAFLPITLESVLGKCTSFKMVRDAAPALEHRDVKFKYFPAKSLFMLSTGGRGVIRSMDTGNVMCSASDLTVVNLKGETVTSEVPASLTQDIKFAGGQAIITPLHDAVNIRLYYSGTEWLTATNNTIDANWKGAVYAQVGQPLSEPKTFHALFNETMAALGITLNYAALPKDLTYFFLFTHPDYTNIIKNPTHTIQNVMIIQNGTQRAVPFTVHPKIPCPVKPQLLTESIIKSMNAVITEVGVSVQVRNRVYIFKTSTFQRMECLKPKPDHSKSKSFYSDTLSGLYPDAERDTHYPEYAAVSTAALARFDNTVDALYGYYNILYSPAEKWGDTSKSDTQPKVPKALFNTRVLSGIHGFMLEDPDFRSACVKVFENDIKAKTCIFEQAAELCAQPVIQN